MSTAMYAGLYWLSISSNSLSLSPISHVPKKRKYYFSLSLLRCNFLPNEHLSHGLPWELVLNEWNMTKSSSRYAVHCHNSIFIQTTNTSTIPAGMDSRRGLYFLSRVSQWQNHGRDNAWAIDRKRARPTSIKNHPYTNIFTAPERAYYQLALMGIGSVLPTA